MKLSDYINYSNVQDVCDLITDSDNKTCFCNCPFSEGWGCNKEKIKEKLREEMLEKGELTNE